MSKRLFLILSIVSILFITCSRILDSDSNKMKLTGMIFNIISNQPVASANVVINGEDKQTLTDELGRFEFSLDYEETTAITISVSKDSFETISFNQEVKPGKDVEMDSLFLNPLSLTTKVIGTLLNDFNKEPISDGEILIDILDYSIVTNSTGNFEFTFETNEPTKISLVCKQTYFESVTIDTLIDPGTTLDLQNIYLNYIYDSAKISGKVIDARADTAITNVKVSLIGYSNVYTSTDNNGVFSLDAQINLSAPIDILFSKYPFVSNTITIDQISPEEEINIGDVKLIPPTYETITIYGKVENSQNSAIKDVVINITEFPLVSALTDENGRFNFELQVDVDSDMELIFEHDEYISTKKDTIAIPETDLNLGTITLLNKYESAQIKGIIVNKRTGAPLINAKIIATGTDSFTSSSGDGSFNLAFPVSTPTSVNLSISKFPFTSKGIAIDQITPEDVIDLGTISLDPPEYENITISGQVIDVDTKLSISDVTIYISQMPELTTTSNTFGTFNIIAPVDSVMDLDILFSKNDIYNDITITRKVQPETDLVLGNIEMDSKFDPITISGIVLNYTDSSPLEGVNVSIVEMPEHYTKTNSIGEYSLNPIIVQDENIHIAFNKSEFLADTAEVSVSPNTNISITDIPLLEKITKPASIVFLGANPQDIRVKESGGIENSMLVFEIRDSSGIAIDISEDTTVFVEIVSGPGGGESIYPNELRTNSRGEVTTSLTSGTISGPVQIQAYLYNENGNKISSNPATLVIHAGHPDQNHFSIAAAQLNIPGLVTSGLEDIITAYVADKYGNWVADGTPVYFTADGGGIQGYANTTNAEATVIIQSGHKDPEPGANGFVTVTGRTNDVDNQTIETTGQVLFSGHSEITNFSPSAVSFGQGGSATVTFNVWDVENNNPLAAGSKLSVSVSPDTLASVYSTFPEDGLGDFQSGHTSFSYTLVDNPSNLNGGQVMIKLKLTSPNGNVTEIRTGTVTIP